MHPNVVFKKGDTVNSPNKIDLQHRGNEDHIKNRSFGQNLMIGIYIFSHKNHSGNEVTHR